MATAPKGKPPLKMSANIVRLMRSREQEVLLEGPARTGKTFGICVYVLALCEWYPGCKILFIRQTRKSLNHSVLTLWEELLGHDHPVLNPRKLKSHRDEYVFPYAERTVDGRFYQGQSEVHLLGMDAPSRLMSTEYDVIAFYEATEGSLHGWSLAFSRLSNHHMPYNLMIADCNPAAATHWLNLRADEPDANDANKTKMFRICTKLKDNPKFWDDGQQLWTAEGTAYNKKLDNLPPVERARLRDGRWADQSGQVYEAWDPSIHIVQGELKRAKSDNNNWWLWPITPDGFKLPFKARKVEWFLMAVDWGYFPDPGSLALYAVDDHQRAFVCKEWHATKKKMDWWADKIIKAQKTFDVRTIVCDVPQEKVDTLNAMLGGKLNDRGQPIAMLAKKGPGSITAGIDIVRYALDLDEDDEPRLRYLATAPQLEDGYLREELIPTGGAQEYPGYVYHPREDGRPNKELPVDVNNHGLDRDRYAMMYLWANRHVAKPDPVPYHSPLVIDPKADDEAYEREQRRKRRRKRA